MSDLLSCLRAEIRRQSRRELREAIETTRRAVARYRHEIAALKRVVRRQERRIASLETLRRHEVSPAAADGPPLYEGNGRAPLHRFSVRSVKAQRRRLKLSAGEFGQLLGVSTQTVYNWEQGKVRPLPAQLAALIEVRRLGRRDALRRLEAKDPAS